MIQIVRLKKKKMLILFVFILAPVIYYFTFFRLFPIEKELLFSVNLKGSKNQLRIYSLGSNAVTRGNIQFIKIDSENKETQLKVIEDYKIVKKLTVISDSTVEVILGEKYSKNFMPYDTIVVVRVPK